MRLMVGLTLGTLGLFSFESVMALPLKKRVSPFDRTGLGNFLDFCMCLC